MTNVHCLSTGMRRGRFERPNAHDDIECGMMQSLADEAELLLTHEDDEGMFRRHGHVQDPSEGRWIVEHGIATAPRAPVITRELRRKLDGHEVRS